MEAESRRENRFFNFGHSQNEIEAPFDIKDTMAVNDKRKTVSFGGRKVNQVDLNTKASNEFPLTFDLTTSS